MLTQGVRRLAGFAVKMTSVYKRRRICCAFLFVKLKNYEQNHRNVIKKTKLFQTVTDSASSPRAL